jgi:hypothetical protein
LLAAGAVGVLHLATEREQGEIEEAHTT